MKAPVKGPALTPLERIIVPLDVPGQHEAIALIDALPEVAFWKVGLELFVSSGPAVLTALKERGKRIFLDLKLHDIPNTMAGACRAAGGYGVDLLTVHATAGEAALAAAQAGAAEGALAAGCEPPRVIAVTLLTSIGLESLSAELKVTMPVIDYAQHMAVLAKDSGLGGAVCSPHDSAFLNSACVKDFWLVCPGVRPVWAQKGDQQRAMTPGNAVSAGADYLVIGRPITQADDPKRAIARICEEMTS